MHFRHKEQNSAAALNTRLSLNPMLCGSLACGVISIYMGSQAGTNTPESRDFPGDEQQQL